MEGISLIDSAAARRFFRELTTSLGAYVHVITDQGRKYTGRLEGFDPNTLSICLLDAREDDSQKTFPKVFILGSHIVEIIQVEEPFDIKALAQELEKLFPQKGAIKVYEDAGLIMILDKIKVTAKGVEGSGPIAERVKRVYEKFVEERKGKSTTT